MTSLLNIYTEVRFYLNGVIYAKKKYFFPFAILFFTLAVKADYCPSPEAIKPGCKVLVTEAMVKTTIKEHLKEYNLEKLDKQAVKKITQRINEDPESFFTTIRPRFGKEPFNPLVLFIANQLNIHVSFSSSDGKNIRHMLVYLLDKARKTCLYTSIHLNLIGKHASELHLNRIENFEAAYFFSKNANNPTLGRALTGCEYRLADGIRFDLIDNDQTEYKPQFKLNGDYRKRWEAINEWGLYKCKGDTIKDCPFKLES
ncbi:MAG: hypothetical protein V4471_02110 [Pseudomonadota bacterium]